MDTFTIPVPLMSGGSATLTVPRFMSEADFDAMAKTLSLNLTLLRPALTAPAPAKAPVAEPVADPPTT